ncbi:MULTISPECIES: hypothetical protein [unclassified Butyrivibrio]|uniref:hypothetical protein n=1 Tax=unclassified Butyrivibrio TaxID=2639466 RepID=UPI0004253CEA|nr:MULTISPECIES: hypothetical protein [unclassified Butyrivibrio]
MCDGAERFEDVFRKDALRGGLWDDKFIEDLSALPFVNDVERTDTGIRLEFIKEAFEVDPNRFCRMGSENQ